jgi:MFS family permease
MWSARLLSSIGDGLVFVAFPLLAIGLTRSPVLVAGVAFATRLPWLLFALPAGAIADRVSRRKLLVAVEIARTGLVILLAAAVFRGHLLLVELYAAAFLISTLETLFNSASMAVIPQVVGDGDLVHANSRFQAAELCGEQFIGPALGGILFAAAASLPVFADAASYAASAGLLLLALRPARRVNRPAHVRRDDFALAEPEPSAQKTSLHADVKEGLRWLVHEPRLRLVCALIASFALSQGLGLGIIVLYCTTVLHLTGTGFGIFLAVAESGNVVGAWIAPRVNERLGSGPTLVAVGLVCGAAFVVVGLTSNIAVAAGGLIAEAIAFGVGMVASMALRQRLIPISLAGRVSAAMKSIIIGSGAVATLIGGALVALMNARLPFVVGGIAQLVAAVVIGGALARRLAADERHVVDVTETVDLRDQPQQAVESVLTD